MSTWDYDVQTWADGEAGATPISAARLSHIEAGIDQAQADAATEKFGPFLIMDTETTTVTTGAAKRTFRMPFAFHVTAVRASCNTVSSSGIPTVDINESGTTILSTKLTIDANEKTSTTAATPAVISDPDLADDAEITLDVDVAGTGCKGLLVWILGYRP